MQKASQINKSFETRGYFLLAKEQLDLASLTNVMEITPSRSWTKNDIVPKTKLKRKLSSWILDYSEKDDSSIEEHANNLLSSIKSKRKLIKSLGNTYNKKFIFVIYYYSSNTPSINFDKSFVSFAAAINAEIDIDTYVMLS